MIGGIPVRVVDVSAGGLLVAHSATLPDPGSTCRVDLRNTFGPIRLDCQIIRTYMVDEVPHTALSIVAGDPQSIERLRTMFGPPR
jgi:hypothetical protein